MNYIELINQFWSCHKENCFNTSEVALYFHLVHTANSLAWKNPFREGNMFVCASLGISEPTLQRSRDRLVLAGLIKFKSGKVKRELTEYTLLELGKNILYLTDPQSSTQSDTLTDPQSSTQNSEKGLDNNKQNKTKQKNNSSKSTNADLPDSKNDFIEEIIKSFAQKYNEIRGIEYYVANKGKERSAAGKILSIYRGKYPNNSSEDTLKALGIYFNDCISQTADKWMHDNMSLCLIINKFNELNTKLKNGSAQNNKGNISNVKDRSNQNLK